MQRNSGDWGAYLQNMAIRVLLWGALRMPYERRVVFAGRLVSRWISPIAGWRRRIARNLDHVCPELSAEEVRRLQQEVADNAGRALIESYSGSEFVDRTKSSPLDGPGLAPFLEARAEGRPVILVTAHFGNYFAARAAIEGKGHTLAALYRPMRNRWFNDHYVAAISAMGEPVFPADKRGILGYVRHLADGGIVAILVDVFAIGGANLKFFGQPAPTALSAAEWAVKYEALMVPIYAIRQPDGLTFRVFLDAPVTHEEPAAMMQALNDSLEVQVRQDMGQWFWVHRRWKQKKKKKRTPQQPAT